MTRSAVALDVAVRRRVNDHFTLDVHLTLGEECGVLFGPSGAGKTTTLRLIAGLIRPSSGRIALRGQALFDSERSINVPLDQRRIGMIFQNDLLFPHMNVRGNVEYGLHTWDRQKARQRVDEIAALCEIGHLMSRMPAHLSGGERQRVGLARAIAPRPGLLLCDEPVSALDMQSRHALLDRLRIIRQTEAVPMLYVTHSPSEAVMIGNRLFVLQRGAIVAQGPPLNTLASVSATAWDEPVRNVFVGVVAKGTWMSNATCVEIADGVTLETASTDARTDEAVSVAVRSDDILLQRVQPGQSPALLSARNRLSGTLEQVIVHGREAEAVVCVGPTRWFVSIVASNVETLDLRPGVEVNLIIKARSCVVTRLNPTSGSESAAPG